MCKRTMYKRARIPMFYGNDAHAPAVWGPRPRKNGLGTRLRPGQAPERLYSPRGLEEVRHRDVTHARTRKEC